MGTIYENIANLCAERGIKVGRMCSEIKISKGTITDLKMGRRQGLSAATANKIANYFGVSVGYLLGTEEKKAPTDNGECPENEENIVRIAGRDGSFVERHLSDEQLSALVAMINQLPEVEDI